MGQREIDQINQIRYFGGNNDNNRQQWRQWCYFLFFSFFFFGQRNVPEDDVEIAGSDGYELPHCCELLGVYLSFLLLPRGGEEADMTSLVLLAVLYCTARAASQRCSADLILRGLHNWHSVLLTRGQLQIYIFCWMWRSGPIAPNFSYTPEIGPNPWTMDKSALYT